ncbi:hypothetical protein AQJ58_21610 [Streptomyces sp. DSM 15324]|nr:hypothetical protein AQJ58_21610 [Streptomyces sp. DSM 15324]
MRVVTVDEAVAGTWCRTVLEALCAAKAAVAAGDEQPIRHLTVIDATGARDPQAAEAAVRAHLGRVPAASTLVGTRRRPGTAGRESAGAR